MTLQELDATIFAINPREIGAEERCRKLGIRLRTALDDESHDQLTRALLRGYHSTVWALAAVAAAQKVKRGYVHVDHLLSIALESQEKAIFTRGWSKDERRRAYIVDVAIETYLDGSESLALACLKYPRNKHIVVSFTAARMLVEKGTVIQKQQAIQFMEQPDNLNALAAYSSELAETAQRIAQAARTRRSLKEEGLALSAASMGWWAGKYGCEGGR